MNVRWLSMVAWMPLLAQGPAVERSDPGEDVVLAQVNAAGDDGSQITAPSPMPLVDKSRTVPPGTASGLTPGDKGRLMLRSTFGPKAFANRVFWAGINQWQDHPTEWGQGWDALGMRLGSRYGRMAVRNTIRLGADLAFGTDPRYHRCDCSGALARTRHALTRTVITRTDDGQSTFNAARVISGMATPWISDQWYPDRLNTNRHHLYSGLSYLGWQTGINVLREFWPDIRRRFRRH